MNKDSLSIDLKDKYEVPITTINTDIKSAKQFHPIALPSVKQDEIFYYQFLDKNFLTNNLKGTIIETIGKEKMIAPVVRLGKHIEEFGLEKEWKIKINDLYNKLKYKVTTEDGISRSFQRINSSFVNNSFGSSKNFTCGVVLGMFHLKTESKQIGDFPYYVAKIKEPIDPAPFVTNEPFLAKSQKSSCFELNPKN